MKKLRKMKNQKGFTLVEVIVVLVILAIMAAILIPSLVGYIDKARENSIVTETRSIVQATQTLASEAYAKYKQITTIELGDTTTDPDDAKTATTYVISYDDVKKLSEVDGVSKDSLTADFGDDTTTTPDIEGAANIVSLTYTSGGKTCSYPGYEVKDATT